jgi:hypothetical protein
MTTVSFLHAVPVRVPDGARLDKITFRPLPWSASAVMGLVGATVDGAPMLAIGTEWPLSWLRTIQPLPKFDLELLHLRRFSSDQVVATGDHAFRDMQPGGDPPDVTVLTDAGRIGVECTSLTIAERRGAHDLFLKLRQRIQTIDGAHFAKLAGHVIYVWFREADLPDGPPILPHRRSDSAALDALVHALAEYTPDDEALRQPPGELAPETLVMPLTDTDEGARFYAVPLTGGAPGSMLYTLAGFDIGLAYSTVLTAGDIWGEVQRLVDGHDKPGVDQLLITAGGPDSKGNIFPAEEAVAAFLLEHPIGLSNPPVHIERIVLHSWATGRATTLFPAVQTLFGPLYQTITALHHPFAGSSAAPALDGEA